MIANISTARGTRDIFGKDIKIFNNIINSAQKQAEFYDFKEISTPIFEFSEIFERNLGQDCDIISKEIYKFSDKSNHFITLRPEFTAGVARSFINNGDLNQKLPQKLFSYGPLFRYERPQKGRQRQFHQVNFEYFGVESYFADFEIISLAFSFLKAINVDKNAILKINSLGSQQSKQKYQDYLVQYFSKYKADLSQDSQKRLSNNPLRILDSKDKKDIEISANLQNIKQFYQADELAKFEKILNLLEQSSIAFQIDHKLVRGLDYYSSTVFEFISNEIGAQDAILAGGRYDNLLEKMGGKPTPAIGFAAGIERLMLLSTNKPKNPPSVAVIFISENEKLPALQIAQKLREIGIRTQIYLDQNFKKQMKLASRDQHKLVIINGQQEVENNEVTIKNFETGENSKLPINDLAKIKNLLLK